MNVEILSNNSSIIIGRVERINNKGVVYNFPIYPYTRTMSADNNFNDTGRPTLILGRTQGGYMYIDKAINASNDC